MKRCIASLPIVLILIFATPSLAADEAWYKTKWGMNENQVSSALEGKLEINQNANHAHTHTSEPVVVAGFKFDVQLNINDTLSSVTLLYKGNDHYSAFLEMKDELKRKYGKPSSDGKGDVPNFFSEFAEWFTEYSIIRISHIAHVTKSGTEMYNTKVLYKPRTTKEDKL